MEFFTRSCPFESEFHSGFQETQLVARVKTRTLKLVGVIAAGPRQRGKKAFEKGLLTLAKAIR